MFQIPKVSTTLHSLGILSSLCAEIDSRLNNNVLLSLKLNRTIEFRCVFVLKNSEEDSEINSACI